MLRQRVDQGGARRCLTVTVLVLGLGGGVTVGYIIGKDIRT